MRARPAGACQSTNRTRYLCSPRMGRPWPRRWGGIWLRCSYPSGFPTVSPEALWGTSAGLLGDTSRLIPTTLRVGALEGLQRLSVPAVLVALRAVLRGPEGAPESFS